MKRKSWNAYSKEEEKMIIELRKAGKSTSEIAYALGRSPKAVSLKITHMKANGKMEGLYVDGVKVAEVNSNLIEKSEPEVVERVREISPREMIKKLYDFGLSD